MKKILISTLVLVMLLSVTVSATTTIPLATSTESGKKILNKNQKAIVKADPICAQTALGKRDAAVTAALQKYSADWIQVLNVRTASQKAAFLKEGRERVNANLAATKIKKTETQKVQRTLNQSKKLAWDFFRVEMRACGIIADSSLDD